MTTGTGMPSPRAFVTWAHRDPEWDDAQATRWREEVRSFAYVLRSLGVDAEIDLFRRSQRGIDWTRYGPKEIEDRDWVLVVLSRAWLERWQGRNLPTIGAGAAAEADALRGIFSKNQQTFREKVILVRLPSKADGDLVPIELHGVHRATLTDFTEGALEPLIRILTDQPEDPIPELGRVPVLPSAADPVRGDASAGTEPTRDALNEIDEEIRHVKDALKHIPGPGAGEGPHLPWYRAWDQLQRRLTELEGQRASLGGATALSTPNWRAGARLESQIGVAGLLGTLNDIAFSPDGRRMATAGPSRTVRVFVGESEQTVVHHLDLSYARSVRFSPDGTRIATAGNDSTARVWDAAGGSQLVKVQHKRGVSRAVFSADGTHILTASDDKTARIWEAESGDELVKLNHPDKVLDVAITADGRLIATACRDGSVRLFRASDGGRLGRVVHSKTAVGVNFSPDGRLLATASADCTARVWDVETGRTVATVEHDGAVRGVVFTPDGRHIVTAGDDRTGRVWDAQTGGGELTRVAHREPVLAIAVSPDGQRLATACKDKRARVWTAQG